MLLMSTVRYTPKVRVRTGVSNPRASVNPCARSVVSSSCVLSFFPRDGSVAYHAPYEAPKFRPCALASGPDLVGSILCPIRHEYYAGT